MAADMARSGDDVSVIGRTGTPFDVRVEYGKVREFARAVGLGADPESESGARVVAPPTFLTTARNWAVPGSDPWTGVDRNRAMTLHGEQEYVFHGRCPTAGETLTATTRIESVYEKDGRRGGTMRFAVTVTEFRDAEGHLVVEAIGTSIETSRAAAE